MSLKLYLYKNEQKGDKAFIQNRISIIFALSGFVFFAINLFNGLTHNYGFKEIINSNNIIHTLIFTVLFVIFTQLKHKSIRYLQILFLLSASSMMTFQQYDSIYGCALWFSAYMLTYKYGIYESRKISTNLFFIVFMILMVLLSLFISPEQDSAWSYFVFLIFFIYLSYTINKSEIDRVVHSEKDMQNSIHELILERTRLKEYKEKNQRQLNDLESQISKIQKDKTPFDLKKSGLTPAEIRIVEALVTTRGSNKEISESLGIKENTVKQHLYKVFNKMGVDDRFQIIDLCKYNFD